MKSIVVFCEHNSEALISFLTLILDKVKSDPAPQPELEIFFENDQDSCLAPIVYQQKQKTIRELKQSLEKAKQEADQSDSITSVIASMIECHNERCTVAKIAQTFSPQTTIAGVDHYPLHHIITRYPALVNATVPLRNEGIASKILEVSASKTEATLQIIFLGAMHYEIMYELLVQNPHSLQYIEKNFSFVDLVGIAHWFKNLQPDRALFPFKTTIIDWPADKIYLEKKILKEIFNTDASFLGRTDIQSIEYFAEALAEMKKTAKPMEDTLKRAQIILDAVNKTTLNAEEKTSLRQFIWGLWSEISPDDLDRQPITSLSLPTKDPESQKYLAIIKQLMPIIIAQLKHKKLWESAKKGEFTDQKKPRAMLQIGVIPPTKVSLSYEFSKLHALAIIAIIIEMVTAWRSNNPEQPSLTPRL